MASPTSSSAALPALAPKGTDKSDKPVTENGKAANRSKEKDKDKDKDKDEDGISIEELAMPKTMIQRLARSALPPNTQLQRDTILALTKSATLFISHIATFALEDLGPNKKTIQPSNVFAAIEETEFEFMIPTLKAELEKFVAIQASKREESKKKVRDGKTGPDGSTMLVGDEDSIADGVIHTRGADPGAQLEAESAIDRQRSAKRAKGEGGAVVNLGDMEDDDDADMIGVDTQDDVVEEEELDEEATESEKESEDEATQEDRVGTEPEDEGEDDDERTEEDSD